MPNKREFKKYVDALGASIVEEMMISYYNVEGADRNKIADAVGKVIDAIENAKNMANIPLYRGKRSFASEKEYAKEKRDYFRALFGKITSEFGAVVNSAMKDFNSALPVAYKQAQKEAVAQ